MPPAAVSAPTATGQKITIPQGLYAYSPFKGYLLDSNQLARFSSSRIYGYINVSCPSCIADIDKWNEVAPEFMKYHVPVILVFYSKDNFEYIKHLCEVNEIKKFPFPFYLDTKNRFSIQNPFFREFVVNQAVLADKNNNVVLSGDPLHSEKTRALYIAAIQK